MNTTTLNTLPQEIQGMIIQHLLYPDALALKHTNRKYYDTINTGINLKVEWLISRIETNLPCPTKRPCNFDSDRSFCASTGMSELMQKRRQHAECDNHPAGRGCLVLDTKICAYKKSGIARSRALIHSRLRAHATILNMLLPVLVAILVLLVGG